MTGTKTTAWRDRWKQKHNWNVSELAKLCCGWDPSVDIADVAAYNQSLDEITRAVRVKALPALELLWPESGAERLYGGAAHFNPRAASAWAAKEFPTTFPYADEVFDDKPLDARERTSLLTIVGALADIADLDLADPSTAAEKVEAAVKRLGKSVSHRTIATHLKSADEVLDRRR